jgi:hypothetical protein
MRLAKDIPGERERKRERERERECTQVDSLQGSLARTKLSTHSIYLEGKNHLK